MDATGTDMLGWAATCMTIIFFSNGYMEIQKLNTPEEFSILPYVAMFLQSLAWLLYGTVGPLGFMGSVVLTNLVGFTLASYYFIFLYRKFGPFIPSLLRNIIITVSLGAALLLWAILLPLGPELSHAYLGSFATILSLLCFGAPLSQVTSVIQSKNTLGMSPSFTLLSTLVTALWSGYGYMIDDFNVFLPNAVGLFLCFIQWSLFAIYGFPRQSKAPLPL